MEGEWKERKRGHEWTNGWIVRSMDDFLSEWVKG